MTAILEEPLRRAKRPPLDAFQVAHNVPVLHREFRCLVDNGPHLKLLKVVSSGQHLGKFHTDLTNTVSSVAA